MKLYIIIYNGGREWKIHTRDEATAMSCFRREKPRAKVSRVDVYHQIFVRE